VFRGDRVIATVKYSLEVSQNIIGKGKGRYIPGLKDVNGQIVVVDGEANLVDGKVFTLCLADGRTWPFFAARGDLIKKVFDCRSNGSLE
jgi:hypothetical protein